MQFSSRKEKHPGINDCFAEHSVHRKRTHMMDFLAEQSGHDLQLERRLFFYFSLGTMTKHARVGSQMAKNRLKEFTVTRLEGPAAAGGSRRVHFGLKGKRDDSAAFVRNCLVNYYRMAAQSRLATPKPISTRRIVMRSACSAAVSTRRRAVRRPMNACCISMLARASSARSLAALTSAVDSTARSSSSLMRSCDLSSCPSSSWLRCRTSSMPELCKQQDILTQKLHVAKSKEVPNLHVCECVILTSCVDETLKIDDKCFRGWSKTIWLL